MRALWRGCLLALKMRSGINDAVPAVPNPGEPWTGVAGATNNRIAHNPQEQMCYMTQLGFWEISIIVAGLINEIEFEDCRRAAIVAHFGVVAVADDWILAHCESLRQNHQYPFGRAASQIPKHFRMVLRAWRGSAIW